MTDIVERLRTLYSNYRGGVADAAADGCDDAADEIERLQARLAEQDKEIQHWINRLGEEVSARRDVDERLAEAEALLQHVRAILPMERWADMTKRMLDAFLGSKP